MPFLIHQHDVMQTNKTCNAAYYDGRAMKQHELTVIIKKISQLCQKCHHSCSMIKHSTITSSDEANTEEQTPV